MIGRKKAKTRRDARDIILRNIFFYIVRMRWKKSVLEFAAKFKEVVVKL